MSKSISTRSFKWNCSVLHAYIVPSYRTIVEHFIGFVEYKRLVFFSWIRVELSSKHLCSVVHNHWFADQLN